jgi:DNA-binding NtrC family response regulator
MKKADPEINVIMITAHASMDSAIEAMREGATDYIIKPFEINNVIHTIERTLNQKKLVEENKQLKAQLNKRYKLDSIIGASEKMQRVYELIESVSKTLSNVLILGESGTGKELVANAIHYNSLRKDGPCIKVNCGALTETLLESELFGHEKGAFTGAIKSRKGRFELADNGTLFLDEIGDISPTMQLKLLRVIESREFERVGGTDTIKVDVRLIAATNKDLKKEVEDRKFRQDLFFRLNVVPIHLPPLRERTGDVALLIEHFLEKFTDNSVNPPKISKEAMNSLINYRWPGNVRELENVLERSIVLSKTGTVMESDLPHEIRDSGAEIDTNILDIPESGINLSELERTLVEKAMEKSSGNQSKAARLLGISRQQMIRRLKKYNESETENEEDI